MKKFFLATAFILVLAFSPFTHGKADGVDYWASPESPGVVTNNDCGFVSAVSGIPISRRITGAGSDTIRLHVADRLGSEDELIAPAGAGVEMTSGSNSIFTIGSDSAARLQGIRTFDGGGNTQVNRLDISMVRGSCRLQVRLNTEKPEAILVSFGGVEVLIRRGDVAMTVDGDWRVFVLSGEASVRVRRGRAIGTPVTVGAGKAVGAAGEENLEEGRLTAIRERLPLSFEVVNAALPPLPPMSYILEAP